MSEEKSKPAPVMTSREVVESYIFATGAREEISIYSERLMLRLIEIAQKELAGVNLREQVSIGTLGEAKISIPIKDLLLDGDENYTQAKAAIVELMHSPQFFERPKMKNGDYVYDTKGEVIYEFFGFQILNDCNVNVRPGYAELEVNKHTWRALLDFSHGFRKWDLAQALRLKRTASIRLYRLLANQDDPITYSIDELRSMWGMDRATEESRKKRGKKVKEAEPGDGGSEVEKQKKYKKYETTAAFIKRVIKPAQEEITAKCSWTFDIQQNCAKSNEINKGRRGRPAITSITFIPIRKLTNSLPAVLKEIGPKAALGSELYDVLKGKFGFDDPGIVSNMVLFVEAQKSGVDVVNFLYGIASLALHANNPQGYVINALRRHLVETCGYLPSNSPKDILK